MAEKVRVGTVILTWKDGLVQVGTSPEHSFTVTSMEDKDVAWLRDLLAGRVSPNSLPICADRRALLQKMRETHLLEPVSQPALSQLRLRIVGIDRITAQVARLLVEEGARFLDLRDSRPVDWEVEYLFEPDSLGTPRGRALRGELAGSGVFLGRSAQPQLVISSESRVIEPKRAASYLYRDVTQLPIILEDRSVLVGPLLVPGSTACFNCLDHQTCERVAQWPCLKEQLLASPTPLPTPSLAAAAAGFAANLLQSFLLYPGAAPDGSPTLSTWFAGKQWRLGETGVTETVWEPHSKCGCQAERLFEGTGGG